MSTENQGEMPELVVKAGPSKKSKDSKESKKASGVKKLDPESVRLLKIWSDKANKKDYGQKIRDNELIHLGLSLITSEHIEVLQQKSIRGKDRQTLAYEKYQKEHGKIPLDEFINKVFSGEINLPRG